MCFPSLSCLEVSPHFKNSLFSKDSGLLWTSNRRIRKAFNRRRSSGRRIYSPFAPSNMEESTFGRNSSPSTKPFIFVNNPRPFAASPISPPTSPFIFVNPSPTPSSRPTSPFIQISPGNSTTLEKSSQNRLSAHKRKPYIIVNPRAEAEGRNRVIRKMLRNPNFNSQPRSIPNSYLPMTSNANPLGFALPLFYLIYLTT